MEKSTQCKKRFSKKKVESRKKPKNHIEQLKVSDSKFYEYLKKNDPSLLSFNEASSETNKKTSDEENSPERKTLKYSGEEKVVSYSKKKLKNEKRTETKRKEEITNQTTSMANKCCDETFNQHSIDALKDFLVLFKEVCNFSGETSPSNFTSNPKVFQKITEMALTRMKNCFDFHLDILEDKKPPNSTENWKKYYSLIKDYLLNLLHFLEALIEESMLSFTLRQIYALLDYFYCFPKLTFRLIQKCISHWEASEGSSRILSYLCIHQILLDNPKFYRKCATLVYSTYLRQTNFLSQYNSPGIQFMENCCVELFKINNNNNYELIFRFIRQMADLLYQTIKLKNKEFINKVYNLKYIHSLKLFSRVISEENESLKDLKFPLIQVIFGTIKMIPSAQYFPFRYHCLNILRDLNPEGEYFIPSIYFSLEMLTSTYLKKKPKPSTCVEVDIDKIIRFRSKYLGTKSFQNNVIKALMDELYSLLSVYSFDIGFPEFSLPLVYILKKHLLNIKNSFLISELKKLIFQIKETVLFIGKFRVKYVSSTTNKKNWKELLVQEGNTPIHNYYSRLKKIESTIRTIKTQVNPENDNMSTGKLNPKKIETKKLQRKSKTKEIQDIVTEFDGFLSDTE